MAAKESEKVVEVKTVKVYAPNDAYTGTSAGVGFVNGEATVKADDEYLLGWFAENGYRVGE